VLLSSRDTDGWWKSASNTIFQIADRELPDDEVIPRAQMAMAIDMFKTRFTPDYRDETAAKRAYEAHNAEVRASVPADKLIDYHPGDGWEPICDKLGLPVPSEPFPHLNTTDDFRAMTGMEPLT
jgi:hypothetical protein